MTPTPAPPQSFQPADPTSVPAPALDPSSGDWWWQYGLDGIVGGVFGALLGGVIAGVATWIAVTKTLENDRELARSATERAERAELRREVSELQGQLIGLSFAPPEDVLTAAWIRDSFTAMTLVYSKARSSEPELAEMLDSATDWLTQQREITDDATALAHAAVMKRFLRVVGALLHGWLTNPGAFAGLTPVNWDRATADDGN